MEPEEVLGLPLYRKSWRLCHVFLDGNQMTSIDFAAAQQRVAERQQRQVAEPRARLQSQRDLHASSVVERLPKPLQSFGRYGLTTWDVIKRREGTKPAFRVGQVDAELLDEELLELLKGQVGDGLKYFGVYMSFRSCHRASNDIF